MKYCLGGLLISMSLFITACKKDNDDDKFNLNKDYGCIERIYINKNDHIINSADVATVNKLFADNNIDNSNFRYTRYVHNVPPAVVADSKSVRVDQYVKGLRIIYGDAILGFTRDVLTYDTRRPLDVARLDTIARVPLQYLKWMFLNDVQKDGYARHSGNYLDSCLYAELGFYELSNNGNTPGKYVKAWLVKGKADYPIGIYKDDDGSSISFSNGIVTF